MSANDNVKWVRLGDYIEPCDERNNDGKYTLDYVRGISTDKRFIPTKANMDGVPLFSYKIVNNSEFAYVADTSRRGDKIALALNTTTNPILISSIYTTFKSKENNVLLPEYLFLLLSRSEFDRYARFNSWGSARETFDWSELCRVEIPLPNINLQKELVATYNGLKSLAEQNEALTEPLSKACEAMVVDCKNKYSEVTLGEYIEESTERNINNAITLTQGVDVNMQFIPAKREAEDKEGTKIVRTGQFAFNKVVKANGTKLPIAYRIGPDCIISSSYAVFYVKNIYKLIPKFLMLCLSRSEFHRYCGYISQGTTRDVFDFDDLCKVKIPLPPIEVQQSIVDLYKCLEEAKKIASEAREKLKTLCPALVQKAANS